MQAAEWQSDTPIYRQLEDKISGLILDGSYLEGEALPSIRQVSSDLGINHLTVGKAYQNLVDQGLVEKRRGLGMFVVEGAREALRSSERSVFLENELPQFVERIKRLGFELEDINAHIARLLRKNG